MNCTAPTPDVNLLSPVAKKPLKGNPLRAYQAYIKAGARGIADHELCAVLGLPKEAITRIRQPLTLRKLIRLSNVCRRTPTGVKCSVFVVREYDPMDAIQDHFHNELKEGYPCPNGTQH